MINNFSFINNQWLWHVVLATLLLWFIFAWKEWKQINKSKLYLKLIFAFISLTSLALILLKPLIISDINHSDLVLITKGYSSDRLDSLKKIKKNIKVQDYNKNDLFINPNKIPSSIYILGEGIAPFDFYQIDSLNVLYLGKYSPSGIIKLNYRQEQVLGNSIRIEGLYANAKKGNRLVLENQTKTSLDSIVFVNDSTQTFKLSAQLNVIGNYEYNIVEKDSLGVILNTNPFGVKVVPKKSLSILIINEFPTFETKYLKNYLAEKGHKIVIRSQVTRDKFKYEYFNKTNKPLVNFKEKSLQKYDLIIIDSQSFKNLGKNQKKNLETVVKNDGIGVFIQSNTNFNNSVNYLTNFSFKSDKTTKANLENWPKTNINKSPFSFESTFALQPIHQINGNILAAYKPLGNGRIGTSVFENTFQLTLSGSIDVYQSLWSKTFNELSRKNIVSVHWETNEKIIFKDEPFNFSVRTHINNPKVIDDNNDVIPLINDINNSSLWRGKTYPTKVGWQTKYLTQDSTEVFNYFVTDTTYWKSLKSHNTIINNKRQFDCKQQTNKSYKTKQPISTVWLYIIFLLSISYLWLEPKL